MNLKNFGQLFITGVNGTTLTNEEKEFLTSENIGGVILFSHNFESVAQVSELINEIQRCRDDYPLFISVDQEGGRVRRFKKTLIQLPPMFEVAKADSPKLTFETHRLMAQQLNAIGVNLNYAPCCDIWSNPKNNVIGDRSFGVTAQTVEKHVSAAIRGLKNSGIITVAKHFPGHGDTLKDSHYDLPYIKKKVEELKNFEIIPFQKAVRSKVDMIMMAHLVIESIDPTLPATLSSKMYDFLRETLKFSGIIITDDMEMHAITKKFGVEKASVMALQAGCDVLIYRSFENFVKAYTSSKKALKERVLKIEEIDKKIEKVISIKKDKLSHYVPTYIPDIEEKLDLKVADEILKELGSSDL